MEDLKVKNICETCNGTGVIDADGSPSPCSPCNGDGYLTESIMVGSGDVIEKINDILDKLDDIWEAIPDGWKN